MESNYNSLFTFTNGIISIINIVLLVITINRYNRTKTIQLNGHQEVLGDTEDCSDHNQPEVEVVEREEVKRADVLMSKQTEDRLLEEFEKAQKSRFFLKKGVSLNDLAEMLGTNQRYVSYILNKHAGMDFNNFVQQARVEYLISSVEKDPDLLNVKFAVLADQAGFSSISKFSSVFKAIKGMPPSEYFQRVRSAL